MPALAHRIIAGCWLIFCIYWLLKAFAVKRVSERNPFLSSLQYKIPIVVGAALLWDTMLLRPLNATLTPSSTGTLVLAVAACLAGLSTAIWARRTLAGNWSGNVTFKKDHELVTTGPYRFVRHPIYSGILLMVVGVALEHGRLRCWLGVVVWIVAFWIKLKQEEVLMGRHFPGEYPAYCRKVKALVPFVI